MKRVLLTQPIPPAALELMQGRVEIAVSSSPEDDVICSQVLGCHGLLVRSATRLSRQTILAADSLEVISRTGAGVDNVDVVAASERGIPVCHTPEANASSVAEHTLALMLTLAKEICHLDKEVRQERWKSRDSHHAFDLKGKILGLVGLGHIGKEVARLATSFGMFVLAYDPYLSSLPGHVEIERVTELQEVFRRADIVSLHIPLTSETKNLVGARYLELLKPTAILINTSRGGVLDEPALADALSKRKLGGAGLDVFSTEPLAEDHPLLHLPNVVLTPHTAALTGECRLRMARDAVAGLLDVLEGRNARWVANSEALQAARQKQSQHPKPLPT